MKDPTAEYVVSYCVIMRYTNRFLFMLTLLSSFALVRSAPAFNFNRGTTDGIKNYPYSLSIYWKNYNHINFRNYRYRKYRVAKRPSLSSKEFRLIILTRCLILEISMLILLTPFLMGIVETLLVRS